MLFTRRFLLTALGAATVAAGLSGGPAKAQTGKTGKTDASQVPKGLVLVMFEQQGCPYCAAWNRDVAPTYSKTSEGQAAPLYRRDIHDPIPPGMKLTSPPQFTPTFVLLDDGREVGRIQGYPGADFFWALLDGLLKKAKALNGAPPKA